MLKDLPFDHTGKMRLKVISCRVFSRPIMAQAAASVHKVDINFIGKFLHEKPEHLGRILRERINKTSRRFYDAVILGYGMCGNSTAGLTAGSVPLVLPRVHDCVSMFLGSHARYMEEFEKEPGTFWYIPEYLETRDSGCCSQWTPGHPLDSAAEQGCTESDEKFSEDNAEYIREKMSAWKKRYNRAVLLETGTETRAGLEEEVAQESVRNNWEFVRMKGSPRLFEKLINGPWDEEFLVLQPGEKVPSVMNSGS
ncbi:MAG: DUF1638 domain-containing protein [Acidobacteriota bacterium]